MHQTRHVAGFLLYELRPVGMTFFSDILLAMGGTDNVSIQGFNIMPANASDAVSIVYFGTKRIQV